MFAFYKKFTGVGPSYFGDGDEETLLESEREAEEKGLLLNSYVGVAYG